MQGIPESADELYRHVQIELGPSSIGGADDPFGCRCDQGKRSSSSTRLSLTYTARHGLIIY